MPTFSQDMMRIAEREKQNRQMIVQQLIPLQNQMIASRMSVEQKQEKQALEAERRAYEQAKADEAMRRSKELVDYRANVDLAKKLQEKGLPLSPKEQADLMIKEASLGVAQGNLALRQQEYIDKKSGAPDTKKINKSLESAKNEINTKTKALDQYSKVNNVNQLQGGMIRALGNDGKFYLYQNGEWFRSKGEGKKAKPLDASKVANLGVQSKVDEYLNKRSSLEKSGEKYNEIRRAQIEATGKKVFEIKPSGKL